MLSDAYIEATCDGCHVIEVIQLTATACRGWDERNVAAHLTRIGWLVDDDTHLCDECKPKTEPQRKRGKHGSR